LEFPITQKGRNRVYYATVTAAGAELIRAKLPKGAEIPRHVAVKQIPNFDEFKGEITIANQLLTANLNRTMKYYGCLQYDINNTYFVIMEFLDGYSDLYSLITETILKKADKKIITNSLAAAILELHNANFVHRDIKPENIMVNTETFQVKLIDIGYVCQNPEHIVADNIQSIVLLRKNCQDVRGTKGYIDPDMFRSRITFEKMIDYDWFAFVIVLEDLYDNSGFLYNFMRRQPRMDDRGVQQLRKHTFDRRLCGMMGPRTNIPKEIRPVVNRIIGKHCSDLPPVTQQQLRQTFQIPSIVSRQQIRTPTAI